MKRILFFILLLVCFEVDAQVKQQIGTYGVRSRRMQPDSSFRVPTVQVGIKDAYAGFDTAQLYYRKSDSALMTYTGSQWILARGAAGGGWGLTGNAGTIDGTNFIGTTDLVPFNIRVSNVAAGRIDSVKGITFYGYKAGYSNSTGIRNIAVGRLALVTNSVGNNNAAIGVEALRDNISSNNTAMGNYSLYRNTEGLDNTAGGINALFSTTVGDYNSAFGGGALSGNTEGNWNTGIGRYSGISVTTGSYNSFLGAGVFSDVDITTGSGNTIIGARLTGYGNVNNNVIIGDGGDLSTSIKLSFDSVGQAKLNQYTTSNFNGGVAADSVLVVTSVGVVKKRDAASFGGGGTPAGNYGNLQINRNGAFATPGSDSLDFESATGLTVKGNITSSTLTAVRVPVIGTAGLFEDDAGLKFYKAVDSLVTGQITVTKVDNYAGINGEGIVQIKRDALNATGDVGGFADNSRFSSITGSKYSYRAYEAHVIPYPATGDTNGHIINYQSRADHNGPGFTQRLIDFGAAITAIQDGKIGTKIGYEYYNAVGPGLLDSQYAIYIHALSTGTMENRGIFEEDGVTNVLGGETFVKGVLQVNNKLNYGVSRITMGGNVASHDQRIAYYEGPTGNSFYGHGIAEAGGGSNYVVATWVSVTPSATNMANVTNLGGEFITGGYTDAGDFKLQVLGNSYISGTESIGTTTSPAKFSVLSTTEQQRILYDASNYYSTTVGSTGGVTFNAVGSGSAFTFSDNISGTSVATQGTTLGVYNIDRTIAYAVSDNNHHGFSDKTDFRLGTNAFNSFSTFVTFGNSTTNADHYSAFQNVWRKDSSNSFAKVYGFVNAMSTITAGNIDTLYGYYNYSPNVTGGTIGGHYGIYVPAPTGATRNVSAFFGGRVGIGTAAPTVPLDIVLAQNTGTYTLVTNSNAGTGAYAGHFGSNGTYTAGSAIQGTGRSTYGAQVASDYSIYTASPGIVIMADNASGVIKFATGGSSDRGRINASGEFQIGSTSDLGAFILQVTGAAHVTTTTSLATTTATARLTIGAQTASASTAPIKFITGTKMTAAEAGAFEYTTPQLFFTNGGAIRQELFQGQQSRVSTQYDNTTTTLGDITGLTSSVAAGKIYRFEAKIYTTSNVGGGVKVAIAGTATATAIIYEAVTHQGGGTVATGTQRAAALATAVGDVTAVTTAYVIVTGTITVNGAGTLTVQAAANTAVGTTSVLVGSTFVITEML